MAKYEQTLPGMDLPAKTNGKPKKNGNGWEPPNLGKAIRMTVPDFNDPNRPLTCLEVDFPIAPINALSNLEGNAGKPIYQMSKWWARRRSSVFRAMLIAAATQAPEDRNQAAKLVWDHYYANHQKAGSFKKLRVLEPFMGGGTTLVEGSRLGFQLTGIDLNPVAWFVCKNELACSDPEMVAKLFDEIETEVKPQIQPFYTTTCPRGHKGKWIDTETGKAVDVDPLTIPPEQRKRYRWEGPEVIYTFWAKHGPCKTSGCGHRTPIFRDPVIAQKSTSRFYLPTTCSPGETHAVAHLRSIQSARSRQLEAAVAPVSCRSSPMFA
jgi:putative DNA methylase